MRPATAEQLKREGLEQKAARVYRRHRHRADMRQAAKADAHARKCEADGLCREIRQAEQERRSADRFGILPSGERAPSEHSINELRAKVRGLGHTPPKSEAERKTEAWLSAPEGKPPARTKRHVGAEDDDEAVQRRMDEIEGRSPAAKPRRGRSTREYATIYVNTPAGPIECRDYGNGCTPAVTATRSATGPLAVR